MPPEKGEARRKDGHSVGHVAGHDSLPSKPLNPKTQRTQPATEVFRQNIVCVERARLAAGISQEALREFAGIADRAYAKLLNPDAPGGRQSGWAVLQALWDVLAPDGIDMRVTVKPGPKFDAIRQRFELRYDRAFADAKIRRALLDEWGRRGGIKQRELALEKRKEIGRQLNRARNRKLSKEKRAELASRASRSRWLRERERGQKSGAKL